MKAVNFIEGFTESLQEKSKSWDKGTDKIKYNPLENVVRERVPFEREVILAKRRERKLQKHLEKINKPLIGAVMGCGVSIRNLGI